MLRNSRGLARVYKDMMEDRPGAPTTHATKQFERMLDLRRGLAQLAEERLCAKESGLVTDRAYMGDLEQELDYTNFAYAQTVLFALVELRGELDGAQHG
jgi:hypothetical protein